MRKSLKIVTGALALATVGTSAPPLFAGSPGRSSTAPSTGQGLIAPDVGANGVLKITDRGAPQTKRLALGKGKSLLIDFPYDLRDVLVGDPESVDAVVQTSNRVFLVAKKTGQTNAFFFDANGNQVLTLEITVGADLTSLDDLIRRLIPGSNVRAELAGSAIAITGSVRTPADSARASEIANQFAKANSDQLQSSGASAATAAGFGGQSQQKGSSGEKQVINLLTIEGEDQVMLRVQVAEVQRTALKQFGIDLGLGVQGNNFNHVLGSVPGGWGTGASQITGVAGAGGVIKGASTGIGGSIGFGGIGGISYAMKTLEKDGLIKTLAEPNLTAVSGETAKFLAGGEFPIESCTIQGCTITYKQYGIGLAFTPVVMSEGRISLKIETEVSELDTSAVVQTSNGRQVFALKTRQAKSTVEIPSGGSLAMAGLISEVTKHTVQGFPGLKDLPVLGTLFRSTDFQKDETELVIIVTPYAVRPTAAQNLARPTDGLAAPSDMKMNFLGHLNKVYGKGTSVPDGGLKGDHGFIVE
jgi:pilus assembly protein CpaC